VRVGLPGPAANKHADIVAANLPFGLLSRLPHLTKRLQVR
jgi:hypothetical protein